MIDAAILFLLGGSGRQIWQHFVGIEDVVGIKCVFDGAHVPHSAVRLRIVKTVPFHEPQLHTDQQQSTTEQQEVSFSILQLDSLNLAEW